MAFERAAKADELWSGEMKGVVVAGRKILLINIGDVVHAYEDRCAHQGVALSQGRLEGTELVCSAHEWRYDACSGRGVNPATARLPAFRVKVEDGQIWVDVERGEVGRG